MTAVKSERPMYPTAPPLAYAPAPRWPVRRWKAAVVLTLLAAVAAGSPWWLPRAWRHVELLYWQHRCMVDDPPAGTVAYAVDGDGRQVAAWTAFVRLIGQGDYRADGVVFLHERRTPAGQRRLVCVLAVDADQFANGFGLTTLVIGPGTLDRDPRIFTPAYVGVSPVPSGTLATGTADPDDPTHFSFTDAGRAGSVRFDGWLTDDDRVVYEHHHASP